MTYTRNLVGYTPAPRFDKNPFLEASIGEGTASTGPFTTIDTIVFEKPDPDPSRPEERNLTTTKALVQYGAWYLVTFRDAEGAIEEATAVPGPTAPLPEDKRREWLSRILQNAPHIERETLIGDGTSLAFYLRGRPAPSPTMQLTVGGAPKRQGDDYLLDPVSGNLITFREAPAANAIIQAVYFQSVWPEAELAYYIGQAEKQYTDDLGVVYQSAIFGLDAILLGLATALNFGSGEESYDMASIFTRVEQTRTTFDEWLVQRQDEGAPITLVDIYGDDIGAGDPLNEISEINPYNLYPGGYGP